MEVPICFVMMIISVIEWLMMLKGIMVLQITYVWTNKHRWINYFIIKKNNNKKKKKKKKKKIIIELCLFVYSLENRI